MFLNILELGLIVVIAIFVINGGIWIRELTYGLEYPKKSRKRNFIITSIIGLIIFIIEVVKMILGKGILDI